ncbi:MAG TPA: flagella protein [Euryarchaeota archaeon]|nr:flagella protein [Euryarchaeota archaeon]
MVFGRKKKEDKEEEELELEELEELLGEEEQVIPVTEEKPPETTKEPAGAPGPPPELDEIKVAIKDIQEQVTRMSAAIENLRRDIDTIREDLREKENQIRKLTSVYELVSQQINPFVEAPKPEAQPEAPKEETKAPAEEEFAAEVLEELEEKKEEKPEEKPVAEKKPMKEEAPEVEEAVEIYEKPTGILKPQKPILDRIPNDFISTTITLRWIGFLLERVDRKSLPLLLEYYKDIGWISDYAKRQLMAYARGIVQDVSYSEEELIAEFGGTTVKPEEEVKRSIEDWRLPAEDHIKSLIFIMRIKGEEIDKDLLNSIEMEIKKLRRSLEGYYGV